MGTKLPFEFLCEVTEKPNRLHKKGECSWADAFGFWSVVVDTETGAAFTINTPTAIVWDCPLTEAQEAFKGTGERLADDLEARR